MQWVLLIIRHIHSIWSVSYRLLKSSFWTSSLLLLLLCYITFFHFPYGMFSEEGFGLQGPAVTRWGSIAWGIGYQLPLKQFLRLTAFTHPPNTLITNTKKNNPPILIHNFSSSVLFPFMTFLLEDSSTITKGKKGKQE